MKDCCGPGYASPQEAIEAPREKLLYTIAGAVRRMRTSLCKDNEAARYATPS
jgi:hypothetical protein